MHEFVNAVMVSVGTGTVIAIGYYWQLASKEVREESEQQQRPSFNQQRFVSPALRNFKESR